MTNTTRPRFDLADYGDMKLMAHAAIGAFPRVEIDPADAVNLIDRIARLEHIIRDARFDLRPPTDPDCPDCWGGHQMYDDHGRCSLCPCCEPYTIAIKRYEAHAEMRREAAVNYERDHGHSMDEKCRPSCPVDF